ncbi:MAG: hypothetical protein GXO14_03930 [Thermococci archaeon]|nr:hypothetical protein [Thermococci archaeon]
MSVSFLLSKLACLIVLLGAYLSYRGYVTGSRRLLDEGLSVAVLGAFLLSIRIVLSSVSPLIPFLLVAVLSVVVFLLIREGQKRRPMR